MLSGRKRLRTGTNNTNSTELCYTPICRCFMLSW